MNKKTSFWRSLTPSNRFVVGNLYGVFFAQGFSLIMLGSILPMLKADYNLTYQVGGMLLSMQSVGFTLAGIAAGYLPRLLGVKKSFVTLTSGISIGLVMMLVSGNPVWLLAAMFLTGISRGAVDNYNNQIMSEISEGATGPMNLLHAFYAIGACLAPVAVIAAGSFGWKTAVIAAAVVSTISLVCMGLMKLENDTMEPAGSSGGSYGFLKEKIFWICVLLIFFYQAVESTMMGWTTTFFIDTNVVGADSAQLITSALWLSLLVGRILSSRVPASVGPAKMLAVMTAAQLVCLALLVRSHSFAMMLLATVLLGLSLAGIYGTSVSNAGSLFVRYPVCMGFFMVLTSVGAIIAPSIVGTLADSVGIRAGMSSLLIFSALLAATAFYNLRAKK